MQSIHYFPRYSQRENAVTNNTLLLLLRLMEASRTKFEEFITSLAGDADLEFSPQWLRIGQQHGTRESVVDGYIAQDSFKIAVETKLTPQFAVSQLERHLEIFSREDHRLLLLLAPTLPVETTELKEFRSRAQQKRVSILATTFERIIEVMRSVLSPNDEEMNALLEDFATFCDESEYRLLPNDRFMMFTPPCGSSRPDNEQFHLYYCPLDRPFRRAQYLGIYANKKVGAIGKIAKVVDCKIDLDASEVTILNNVLLTDSEKTRVIEAARLAKTHEWDITPGQRFYLCDEWHSTNYRKASSGGILGARMLDLRSVFPKVMPATLSEIAHGLSEASWA
jgi:hypothetical protein